MNAVKVSAEAGCWICNHLTSNAPRDQNGDMYPFWAYFGGWGTFVPRFTVELFQTQKEAIYREMFQLSTSKEPTHSRQEGGEVATLGAALMSSPSEQGNGSVKASRTAYTRGGALKRKSKRVSKGMLDGLQ